MTELMNAVILTGFGGPEKLVYTQVPKPTPKPREVLIKVGACSVNNADINTRTGWYGAEDNFQSILQDKNKNNKPIGWQQVNIKFPRIQGNGVAGQIVEVGDQVNEKLIQQRVIVNGCILGENLEDCQYLGSELDGGFAEYTIVPTTNVYPINSPLSDIELASFPSSYATAENMLTKGRVSEADTVLIMGASGGVGSALIQLSKIRGATVIAVVGSGKENFAQELGADYVYLKNEVLADNLVKHQITVVLDVVGGDYFNLMINNLTVRGRYICAGAISSPLVNLNLRDLIYKELEMVGATRYDSTLFERLVRYIEQGLLKPVVAKVFPLPQIKEAQIFFQAKKFFGKIIITP